MEFTLKKDILLQPLSNIQGVVEKKNTLPILSNVLIQIKDNKLNLLATDLELFYFAEINEIKSSNDGSTTTSAAVLHDILRKIPSNEEIKFHLSEKNKYFPNKVKTKALLFVSAILKSLFLLLCCFFYGIFFTFSLLFSTCQVFFCGLLYTDVTRSFSKDVGKSKLRDKDDGSSRM